MAYTCKQNTYQETQKMYAVIALSSEYDGGILCIYSVDSG